MKCWLWLGDFVCAPPAGERARIDRIVFYRFDPATMPTSTMAEAMYEPGDEHQDWYPSHRDAWAWLVETGDPQWDTFDLLEEIAVDTVSDAIRDEISSELAVALSSSATSPDR